MDLTSRFTKIYYLKVDKATQEILDSLKIRINERKSKRCLSFKLIDYKLFTVHGNAILINRPLGFLNSLNGLGSIKISFKDTQKGNLACIEIQPFGEHLSVLIWLYTIFLALQLAPMIYVDLNYIIITLFAIAFMFVGYLNITYCRYKLKYFAEDALNDLDVKMSSPDLPHYSLH